MKETAIDKLRKNMHEYLGDIVSGPTPANIGLDDNSRTFEPTPSIKPPAKINTKLLYHGLSKLCHENYWLHIDSWTNNPIVPFINVDLARFYKQQIEKYTYVVTTTFNCPDLAVLLDVIHKYMQLHERLVNKQKIGHRYNAVTANLDQAIDQFDKLSASCVIRYWRHPKISMLVDLKMQATKMFKQNFVLRQYSS
jgi:hypothetical protein